MNLETDISTQLDKTNDESITSSCMTMSDKVKSRDQYYISAMQQTAPWWMFNSRVTHRLFLYISLRSVRSWRSTVFDPEIMNWIGGALQSLIKSTKAYIHINLSFHFVFVDLLLLFAHKIYCVTFFVNSVFYYCCVNKLYRPISLLFIEYKNNNTLFVVSLI